MIWKNLQAWKVTSRNYSTAKEINIIWGLLDWILDAAFFYYLGAEIWWLAGILFVVSMVSSYFNIKLGYKVQEQMAKDKVIFGKKNGVAKSK